MMYPYGGCNFGVYFNVQNLEFKVNLFISINHSYYIGNTTYLLVTSESTREFEMYNTFQKDGKIDPNNSTY